jgi:hypothetical protein
MKKRHTIEKKMNVNENADFLESSSLGAFPDRDFCMPEGCQETIVTPKFPSPTSCLPEEQLHELEEKIDAANRLLLDLGLSNEERENGRRILLDGLKGKTVKIKVLCFKDEHGGEGDGHANMPNGIVPVAQIEQIVNKKSKHKKRPKTKRVRKKNMNFKRKRKTRKKGKNFIEGKVHLVGRNFVELTKLGNRILIPFSRICVIVTKRRFEPAEHEPALLDIDPCFRRELTFNFGETVAANPDLIQLFFGIQLSKYVESFYGDKLTIYTEKGQKQGILKGIENGSILLEDLTGNPAPIPAESLCYIIKKLID